MIGSREVLVGLALLAALPPAGALDLVKDGKPVAGVVVEGGAVSAGGRRGPASASDAGAARVLVEWVKKITDAELPVADTAPAGAPAILVGAAAVKAGLNLDDIKSPSQEGVRIVAEGNRVLIAGQNGTATLKGVCRFLEELGCRYFMDGPMGEVYPRTRDLSVGRLTITEQPGFLYRSIWGSMWGGEDLWKVWNGAGGIGLNTGHAWGGYMPKGQFAQHPEYFALGKDGQRHDGDWACTSNKELRRIFAQNVSAAIAGGNTNPSLSPPDGTGYCRCPACQAQDDPNSIEPSSGAVCVTNRYVDFLDDVARQVAKEHPESILNFYCYADYTQAPTNGRKLEPNLCAWLAPIRYCRLHAIGSPDCPSRVQLGQMIDGWAAAANKIGYRTYNYNLAECTVPFSLLSVWKHDIPYLKAKGCIGMNLETLPMWELYGPHIYLSIRLSYDPKADADALMDDYFARFYGPKAGPLMKEYWLGLDRAFADLKCHSGSFFAIHLVYTPEFLAKCRGLLDRAAEAARGNPAYAARVAMHSEGLKNAEQYCALRDAMNRGDFAKAKQVYDDLVARGEAHVKAGYGNHYTPEYVKRFLGKEVTAGAEALQAPNKLLQVLPDQWRLAYDEADAGAANGYARPDFDDSQWRTVATYTTTLDAQGLPDRKTFLWYRTKFQVPAQHGKLSLFFAEVDGRATVYVNGKQVGEQTGKRVPFTVDIGDAAAPGANTIAVRVDHTGITELFLGGIIRPVLLVDGG